MGFGLSGSLTLIYSLYMISVRQTRGLTQASFRFAVTHDTLAIGCILPTTGRIRVGSGNGAVFSISIACHLKPCMRFSLTRLSDNLLPTAFKRPFHIFSYFDNKSTLFHWLHTIYEIHTAHAPCISSAFVCSILVSKASSTHNHPVV